MAKEGSDIRKLLIEDMGLRPFYSLILKVTEDDDPKTNFICYMTPWIYGEIKSGTNMFTYTPYLRHLSTMTDDEKSDFEAQGGFLSYDENTGKWSAGARTSAGYLWLERKMFDYQGFIDDGVALPAEKDVLRLYMSKSNK